MPNPAGGLGAPPNSPPMGCNATGRMPQKNGVVKKAVRIFHTLFLLRHFFRYAVPSITPHFVHWSGRRGGVGEEKSC